MKLLVEALIFTTAFIGSFAAVIKNGDSAQRSFIALQSPEDTSGRHCWEPKKPELSDTNTRVYETVKKTLEGAIYQAKSIARFQDAIRVETQTNDDFGDVDGDDRWRKFYRFSAFLTNEFPLVHRNFALERINCHGLVYTWEPPSGQNVENLGAKPFILMAHQDTVPVSNESLVDWRFDPFEGHVDKNGIMYGRGVHDDKNSLISILEAVELLLENGFQPNRTVILAFGFDEEVSGRRGGLQIAKFLEQRYGRHSIEFILDEGPGVLDPVPAGSDIAYATVATAEKGYLDVSIEAKIPGGHSSLAEKHSLIGIMAEMIVSLENINPFLPRVSMNNPLVGFLSCYNFNNQEIPDLLDKIRNGDAKAEYELGLFLQNTSISPMTHTSQAIDLIKGGQKINALPETVSTGINYRISPDSSLEEIKQRIVTILQPIATRYNMTYSFFSQNEDMSSADRLLRVSQIGQALEPAKQSPQDSEAYSIIFGTVNEALGPVYSQAMNVKSLVVVPTLMAGNTDTRHYWNLTENIFRFRPTRIDGRNNGGHTVNEHINVSDHFASVQFYACLVLNASEM